MSHRPSRARLDAAVHPVCSQRHEKSLARRYSARVLTFLDVYRLSRDALEEILAKGHFPRTKRLIHLRVLFMKFQAKMKLIARAVRLSDGYQRLSGEDLAFWKRELRARGRSDDKRLCATASEDERTPACTAALQGEVAALFRRGVESLDNELELRNALASGLIDDDEHDAFQTALGPVSSRNPLFQQSIF